MTNDLFQSLYSENHTILILLDVSAAFNTNNHTILVDHLKHTAGIQGLALQWFTSYLQVSLLHFYTCLLCYTTGLHIKLF